MSDHGATPWWRENARIRIAVRAGDVLPVLPSGQVTVLARYANDNDVYGRLPSGQTVVLDGVVWDD